MKPEHNALLEKLVIIQKYFLKRMEESSNTEEYNELEYRDKKNVNEWYCPNCNIFY